MIKLFWWNTSLSHKNKQNLSDKDKLIVFQYYKKFDRNLLNRCVYFSRN